MLIQRNSIKRKEKNLILGANTIFDYFHEMAKY